MLGEILCLCEDALNVVYHQSVKLNAGELHMHILVYLMLLHRPMKYCNLTLLYIGLLQCHVNNKAVLLSGHAYA